jgi:penicillin-insensitive murein endopeptidase
VELWLEFWIIFMKSNFLWLLVFTASCSHAQISFPSADPLMSDWGKVQKPSKGPSQSIGFYSSGCIAGAVALDLDGPGFQVMKTERNRYYGHSDLIEFIKTYAANLNQMGFGVLVGDLSQPRGGPMTFGHSSHQVGLDADIWFWSHPEQRTRKLTTAERNTLPYISMLNNQGLVDPKRFNLEHIQKLKFAATAKAVQRIFINPAIKTYLCKILDKKDSAWLNKLRPWPGHDSHFHVRLHCPKESPFCEMQEAIPDGDGCSELLLTQPILKQNETQYSCEAVQQNNPILRVFPAACESVLKD